MCKEETIRPKLPAANLLYLQCRKKCSVVRNSGKGKNITMSLSRKLFFQRCSDFIYFPRCGKTRRMFIFLIDVALVM